MEAHSSQSIHFLRQQIAELKSECHPRQKTLLSLIAICQQHQIDPADIVRSYSNDLPRAPLESLRKPHKLFWSRVNDLASRLKDIPDQYGGEAEFPGLLPEPLELALHLESRHGDLNEFNRHWLSQPRISRPRLSESGIAMLVPTFLKMLFILLASLVIMIRVIPEFIQMAEEFQIELPRAVELSIAIARAGVIHWYVLVLPFIFLLPVLWPAFGKFFNSWNPFTWQYPRVPSIVRTRQALAQLASRDGLDQSELSRFPWLPLITAPGSGRPEIDQPNPTNAKKSSLFDWRWLRQRKIISRQEANALSVASSPETRGWILRKKSFQYLIQSENRAVWISRLLILAFNIIAALWIVLIAVGVVSFLLSVIRSI